MAEAETTMSYKLDAATVRKLVTSGDIRINTEIEASYLVKDLSGLPVSSSIGRFLVKTVKVVNGIAYVYCEGDDGKERKILSENIRSIDGMCISRFVTSSFNDNAQPLISTQPRKRGRPRKNTAIISHG